jgi:hypothetical protein
MTRRTSANREETMSEIFYKPQMLLCDDFKTRRVWIKRHRYDGSFAADTFFSVPAYVHHKGKRLYGFVSQGRDEKLRFHAKGLLEPLSEDTKRDAGVTVRTQFWYARLPATTRQQRLGAFARAASYGMNGSEQFETFGHTY